MRKSLLKTAISTIIVGSVILLSNLNAFAGVTNHKYEFMYAPELNTKVNETDNYFTFGDKHNAYLTVKEKEDDVIVIPNNISHEVIDGSTKTVTKALKMEGSSAVKFKTYSDEATVTILWGTRNDCTSEDEYKLKVDGANIEDTLTAPTDGTSVEKESVITVGKGNHSITQGSKQAAVYYVLVEDNYDESTVVPITSVDITPKDQIIYVGDVITLTATLNEGAIGTVTWGTSNKNIATIDSSGKVTGKAEGTVTITATAEDVSATTTVQVKPVYTFVPSDDISVEMKAYSENANIVNGMTAVSALEKKSSTTVNFDIGDKRYTYKSAYIASKGNTAIKFKPAYNGTATVVAKVPKTKTITFFGEEVSNASESVDIIVFKEIKLKADTEYKLEGNTKPNIYYLGFSYDVPNITKSSEKSVPSVANFESLSTYYAVAVIPAAEKNDYSSVQLLGKTSNQIFEKVKINGKEYNASDFLTGAAATDYVFAVKVKNVTDTQTTAIETIQGKPVVFVPVA